MTLVIPASIRPSAARRRRFNANVAVDKADQRAGEGLFQPDSALCRPRCRNRAVERRQQRLDLAEFSRAFMADPVDPAQQQAKADFLRKGGKGIGVKAGMGRITLAKLAQRQRR